MGSEATLAHAQTEVLLAKLARGKGSRFIYIYILKTSKGGGWWWQEGRETLRPSGPSQLVEKENRREGR